MKIVAFTNQKGGVGKTNTTVNLAVGLARMGKKVLIVDTDPQGDATKSLGFDTPDAIPHTLATLMEKCDTKSRNKLPKKLPYPFGVILPQPASLVTAGWEACGTTWES